MDVSKVSEAKAAQEYTTEQAKCSTCANYRSDTEKIPSTYGGVYFVVKNRRCSIGGFAVQASAICKLYERKP